MTWRAAISAQPYHEVGRLRPTEEDSDAESGDERDQDDPEDSDQDDADLAAMEMELDEEVGPGRCCFPRHRISLFINFLCFIFFFSFQRSSSPKALRMASVIQPPPPFDSTDERYRMVG
jgi:hypothetical protein